jgi:hypothetical protein
MSQVSRPVQALLLVTLLFAAVWLVALRPKSASGGGASASAPAAPAQTTPAAPGVGGLKSAVDKAHGAVTTASGDAQRATRSSADGTASTSAAPAAQAPATADAGRPAASAGAPASHVSSGSTTSASGAASHPASGGRTTTHAAGTPAPHRLVANGAVGSVRAALRAHKAVAVAFVDSSTADSQAVERELLHVSRFGGRAFLLSVPLADLSAYAFITKAVEVTVAPTVVIVDPRHRATTIVGFADRGEIEQRLADALAVEPRR